MRTVTGLILLLVLVAFLVSGMLLIHPFGNPSPTDMDDYIIENAQNQTGSNSVVASVVFDYRGFDTLGEATILFTAVTGVLLLLRTVKHKKENP
ncbi:MAG TPA: hydrogen gas-evolving membrane-bound hydrogenase subunit E [Dehalococcoidia bacterium]